MSFCLIGSLSIFQVLASNADSLKTRLGFANQHEKASILNQLAKTYLSISLDSAADFSRKAGMLAEKLGQTEQLAFSKKYLGITSYYLNDTSLALQYYNDALRLFETSGNEFEVSNTLNNKALIFYANNNFEQAIKLHQQALQIREKLNNPDAIIGSLINLGNCYNEIGDNKSAITYFEKALEINKLIDPKNLKNALVLGLGSTYSVYGDYYRALELYNQAIGLADSKQDFQSLVALLNNRGNVFLKLGDLKAAINDYEQAIKNQTNVLQPGQLSSLLLNLGNVYLQTDQYQKAKTLYYQAKQEAQKTDNWQVVARAMLNLSLIFDQLKQSDSAYYYIEKAYNLPFTQNNTELNTTAANIFGSHLEKAGKLPEAEIFLQKAYHQAIYYKLMQEQAKATLNLGNLYFKTNRFYKARQYLEESLKINQQTGNLDLQIKNLLLLSTLSEETGNLNAALFYQKNYAVLYDSLFDIKKQEQVSQVEGRLNLRLKEGQLENQRLLIEKKNKELYLQRARIVYLIVITALLLLLILILYNRKQIKTSRNQLKLEQEQLETEQRLLRAQMNPHFMFNALNSIQAFISENNSLQAEIFLSKFASLMRYYLDSSSKSFVSLDEEIAGLKLNIELEQLRMNSSFSFEIKLDDSIEATECDVPPMLAQPFIENAIKHGLRTKKEPGFLSVSFELIDQQSMRCIIQDNGIGRAAAKISTGRKSTHESKGIAITQKRLAIIWNSKFQREFLKISDLKNDHGEADGTRVEIILPYKN